jgi:serine/threonine protein phosphatase PrpC
MSNGEPIPGASGQQERGEFRKSIDIKGLSVASEKHPERNEDTMLQLPEKRAFGVFDGIGGHAAGDKASQLTSERVAYHMQNIREGGTVHQAQEAIRNALIDANKTVLTQAQAEGNKMGSTAVAGYIWEGQGERKAIIGSVGDSRAYIMREGKLEQITLDDDMVGVAAKGNEQEARALQKRLSETVDPSQLSPVEQGLYAQRNIITQHIGKEQIDPNMHAVDLQPGDKLLLTSDGVSDNLTDKEIATIIGESRDGEAAVRELIEVSKARSRNTLHPRHKADDMSAVVVDVPSDGKESERAVGSGVRSEVQVIPREMIDQIIQTRRDSGINGAKDFTELFRGLDGAGELRGSSKTYQADELKQLINDVRSGKKSVESITREGGLRRKVIDLIQVDKVRKDIRGIDSK